MFAKPNQTNTEDWSRVCGKGLEMTYKTAKRTETDISFPPRTAILGSLFAQPNDWELAFEQTEFSGIRIEKRVGEVGLLINFILACRLQATLQQ